MKTYITNISVITMNPSCDVISDGYVAWENQHITEVGSMSQCHPSPHDTVKNGKHGILMPGMINLHTHLGMVPFRGLGDDCKDRLRLFLFPMEQKAMSPAMAYLSSKYAIAELLLGGVTTVFDMYYYEQEAAKAMDEMGIRGFAGQTVLDNDGCDFRDPEDALAYGEQLIKDYAKHPRVTACVTPHGTNTCSGQLLKKAHDLSRKYQVPYSLHVSEMDYEMDYFRREFQMSPVEYLNSIGVLDEHMIAAHAIHLSDADIHLLKERKSSVAHCIGSNTKAAKGVAPVSQLLSSQIPVGLGTDGPASGNTLDIITQLKLCANFHKNETKNRTAFPAKDIISLATIQGAKALHMESCIGSIEPGKYADLILIETDSVNMFPIYDVYSAVVYSANASNVSCVYVNGSCLVENKKLKYVDISELRRELTENMNSSEFGSIDRIL